jgi:crotonobetainyl-CoA:carnitine CoA-transferase CaiB-like acyl-CoA transferase
MARALSHLRVAELCDDLPGAACARQFAAWGADVTVAEPPGGSPLRRLPPLVPDRDGQPASLVWEYLSANKGFETYDLESEPEWDRLRSLLRRADVFITDRPAAWLEAKGLSYASLSETAPRLVMVAISPFGAEGPYAGYVGSDLVVQALSGILSLSGEPNRAPLKVAANILPYACGMSAFIGALAAVHERASSGRGQVVEVACVEAVASLVLFLRAQYFGQPFPRRSGVGTMLLRCADGHVLCNPRAAGAWDDLLVALEVQSEQVPELLRTPEGRQDAAALRTFLESHSRPWPAAALFRSLGRLMVAGILKSPAQLLADDHLRARDFFYTVDHTRLGRLVYPGPAGQLSETPMLQPSFAEGSAQGGREAATPVRDQWNSTPPSDLPALNADPPLAGVRVLDLTTAWIGPYAGMLLADLGADVIKIEGPQRPDVWRFFYATGTPGLGPPPVARPGAHQGNTSHYYNSVNRNKRSLALDLASTRGRELFLQLVRTADIVLENFTPRVLDNFGLSYDVLREANPRLIMVSFSGYGRTGPYRDIKATGATIESIGGWVSLFGYPDEPPMLMGEMEADRTSGLHAAALALVALAYRDRQRGYRGQRPRSEGVGEPHGFPNSRESGQRIDGSMFEAAVGYIGEEILLAGLGLEVPHPRGNRDRAMAPQGTFPCAGDDAWIAITVRHDDDWRALLGVATDAPWLRDPRFDTAAGRLARVDEIEAGLGQWTRAHDARHLMTALQQAGVPAGVVLKTDEVPRDPHFLARGWFRPLTHPDTGTQLHNGHPWRFSRSPLVWRSPSPRLGEHSAEILANELHLEADEIATLFAQGITRRVDDWSAEDTTQP